MDRLRSRGWHPDYLTLRHRDDLSSVNEVRDQPLIVLGAAKLGTTRLIDNLLV